MVRVELDRTIIYAGIDYGPGTVELSDEAHASFVERGLVPKPEAGATVPVAPQGGDQGAAENDPPQDPPQDPPAAPDPIAKAVGDEAAANLREAGFGDLAAIKAAGEADLLAVKGIGEAKLKALRALEAGE